MKVIRLKFHADFNFHEGLHRDPENPSKRVTIEDAARMEAANILDGNTGIGDWVDHMEFDGAEVVEVPDSDSDEEDADE